ncbi:lytic transglycosylase [Endozoicomonas sp. (ex Bugula neritina AB1)]|nr:lytic transglycosylase [Endozoicomonas sp. (ex Bugula neritina AB1)]
MRLLLPIAISVILTGCQVFIDSNTSTETPVVKKTGTLSAAKTDKNEKIEPAKKPKKKVIPKKPDDLWVRIQSGLSMNLDQSNARIDAELNWYKKNNSYFTRVSKRAEPYLYFIVKEAEQRKVPLELALMPVVESAYDAFAYSPAGASGLWQFMPATGRHYKLHQNWWYDGRRDVVSSTRAALDYMSSLHKRFGDWELALAAFNSGPGRVQRAVNKNKKAGKPTNFWALDLPSETTAYVPKLIALGKIVRNPKKYDITIPSVPNKPYFAQVKTGGQLDIAKASKLADVPLDQIYRLNPGLNRWSTPPEGPHYLLVPTAKAKNFSTKLAALPDNERLKWTRYTVKPGDSLLKLSKQYRTRVDVITDVNKLESNVIRVGQTLMIPVAAKEAGSYTLSSTQRLIAKQNRTVSGRYKVEYKVKSGDSFWTIARKYDVGTNELARWNNMSPRDTLRINQTLAVWRQATNKGKNVVVRKVNYKVRSGDSLARIAGKFSVRVTEIREWNNDLDEKYIHPGDMLTLYVDVTKTF